MSRWLPRGEMRPAGPGILTVLILAHAFGTLNFMALLAMAPAIQAALALSRTEFGLLATAYNAGLLAGALPSGWLVDRFGVRLGLVGAHLVMATGTALLATYARTLGAAVPCVVLMGLGYAVVNPATVKGVLLWLPARRRGTAMGLKQTGVPLGGALAAALGGVAARLEWSTLLWGVALATSAGGLLSFLGARDPGGHPAPRAGRALRDDLGSVMRNRNLTVLNMVGASLNVAQASFFTYLILFVREVVHLEVPLAVVCLGLAQAGSTAGRVAWGLISDRLFGGHRKPPLVAIGLLAGVGLVALAGMSSARGVATAGLLALGLGLTLASYAGLLQAAAAEAVAPRLGGAAIGYNMLFMPIGGMIGPPLFGSLVDLSGRYDLAWLVLGGLVLASSLLLGSVFRETHHFAPAE